MLVFAHGYLHFPLYFFFFFSSRRRHTRCYRDWSSDVCSSDLNHVNNVVVAPVFGVDPSNPGLAQQGNTADGMPAGAQVYVGAPLGGPDFSAQLRSEERRVGKECGARWAGEGYRKKSRVWCVEI